MGLTFPKSLEHLISKTHLAPGGWIRDLLKKAVQVGYFLSTQRLLPGILKQCLTSVWRMAALCSLAVSDSLSTSMCCLQSEFWLLRVSSFVCKARSSDSFFESSCFSWSICETTILQEIRSHIPTLYICELLISLNFQQLMIINSTRQTNKFAWKEGLGSS